MYIVIDAHVTVNVHVTAIVKACCSTPSNTQCGSYTTLTLVHTLVVSSVLSGISGQLLQRLQSVFNAAASLVFSTRNSEHITPLLRELYIVWKFWREFSSSYAILAHRCRHTSLRPFTWLPTYVYVFEVLQRRRWSYRPRGALRWVTEPSRWLLLERGTLFHRLLVLRHRCCSSAATWRRHRSSHRALYHTD